MLYRRIRKSDHASLRMLCKNDQRWGKYFFLHSKWVDKALADVEDSNRVVFGAFEPNGDDGREGKSVLQACVFLSLSSFARTVELKNFILPTASVALGVREAEIANSLLERAIRFCEVRGIQRIEIEVPQLEHGLLSLLLSRNFNIVSMRERYKEGQLVCMLERKAGGIYYGDPFDRRKISRFLLSKLFFCIVERDGESKCGRFMEVAFVLQSPAVFPECALKQISGRLLVSEEPTADLETIERALEGTAADEDSIVRLILIEKCDAKVRSTLEDRGIGVIDRTELLEISGGGESTLAIPIPEERIGGVMTVLDQEEISRFTNSESLTYYLVSGIHDGLNVEEGKSLVMAVYCSHKDVEKSGVVGYFKIATITRKKYSRFIEEPSKPDSILTLQDLRYYRVFSEDELVAELKCVEYKKLAEPLPIAGEEWISSAEIESYLASEIRDSSSNTAYLDDSTCQNLLKKKIVALTRTEKPPEHGSQEQLRCQAPFDYFVSYNSRNSKTVFKICDAMKPLRPWIDKAQMKGGEWNLIEIERAMKSARCIVVFLGKNGLGNYQKKEVLNALEMAIQNGTKLICVLLPRTNQKMFTDGDFPFFSAKQAIRLGTVADKATLDKIKKVIAQPQ